MLILYANNIANKCYFVRCYVVIKLMFTLIDVVIVSYGMILIFISSLILEDMQSTGEW